MTAVRRRLVVGMGRSGLALARWWAGEGEEVRAVDDRVSPPAAAEFARVLPQEAVQCGVEFGAWEEGVYDDFEEVGVSPGVAPARVRAGRRLTNEAAVFSAAWRRLAPAECRLLAVTGTNGKSTVTALAAHVAGGEAVGNIGTPLLTALARWRREGFPKVVVAELSSFQLELAGGFFSDAAVLLNVGEDHVDRHGDVARYAAIKRRIYANCGRAVVNADAAAGAVAPESAVLAAGAVRYRAEGGEGGTADWTAREGGVWRGERRRFEWRRMARVCREFPDLTLAALALVEAGGGAGLSDAEVAGRLANFAGLPHRRRRVGALDGVTYVDDSKATNVAAAVYALRRVGAPCVWIGGGDGKGQAFAPLAAVAAEGGMRGAVLMGRDAAAIEAALAAVGVGCRRADDMVAAVRTARAMAREGDVVLLAPACSSLDMFADFAARGAAFAEAFLAEGGGGDV